MDSTTYISGHKNPDTDTISAALAYAYLKRALGYDVTPIRLGNINAETRYVLERFNLKEPLLKYDIKATVFDIDFDDPIIAYEDETLKDVWHKMLVNNKNATAIVSEDGKLVGVVGISDITNALLSLSTGDYQYLKVTPLANIVTAVNGVLAYEGDCFNTNGKVKIATSAFDEDNEEEYHDCIVLSSARKESQLKAITKKAAVVIAANTKEFDTEVIKEAKAYNCSLIAGVDDLITITQSITQAIPIGLVMTREMVTFNIYDYIEDVKEIIAQSRYRQYPIVDNNYRIVGMMSRYHLFNLTKKKVILVDHNEISQSIEGIEEAEVVEIIDHHRLGDITTDLPVYFRNEICGSSSTIISKLFEEYKVEIPPDHAGLMLSAIISDTMNFNSPTCIDQDRIQAEKLAEIAQVDINELGNSILAISASLKTKTTAEIIHNDIKEFNINSYKIAIGQVNIMSVEDLKTVREEVVEYMESHCLTNRLDIMAMLFSLIDGSGSYLLAVGKDSQHLNEAFKKYSKTENKLTFLPGIISRKQQVIPIVSQHLQTIKNH